MSAAGIRSAIVIPEAVQQYWRPQVADYLGWKVSQSSYFDLPVALNERDKFYFFDHILKVFSVGEYMCN